ncbi:MAG: 5-oxoprolinase subunit PxpB [Verrucomicrobiota bacterium]
MTIQALGDSAITISLGERVDEAIAARARAIAAEIERHRPGGVVDVVSAFASVAVFYERMHSREFAELKQEIAALAARADEATVAVAARRVEIPVCYGGEFGPDLGDVARHTGLTAAEIIARHAGGDYLVHAIGFAPGFPYLGGLPAELATPRRATPRPAVPAGSVGIGGAQTGVYPFTTPGGWNVIGRTPRALFDAGRVEPALLKAGDRVSFVPLAEAEFAAVAAKEVEARAADVATAMAAAGSGSAHATVGMEVLRAGMLTTVQDTGRVGHRARGVPLSGAADAFALRVANSVLGNAEQAAGLEFTLVGPEVRFGRDTLVALAGADFGLPRGRPLRVRAGDILKLGAAKSGCRGYLAIAGGIEVAPMLGSRSTYLRARLGGWEGRALRDGDVLPVRTDARAITGNWRIDERIWPGYSSSPIVRVMPGAHMEQFAADWTAAEWKISPQSDRMGVRLQGPPLQRTRSGDLVSAPVAPGTIQVPPDGQPIVLLADAQTIGGYPQLAQVIAVDLPLVAQLRPGDSIRFRMVSIDEAHAALFARERAFGLLREGVAQKLQGK